MSEKEIFLLQISDSESDSIRSRQFLLSGGTLLMERSCTIEELQFRQLEEQVWLLMWLVLEPKRLQYLVQVRQFPPSLAFFPSYSGWATLTLFWSF
jgi:hypothetical protein